MLSTLARHRILALVSGIVLVVGGYGWPVILGAVPPAEATELAQRVTVAAGHRAGPITAQNGPVVGVERGAVVGPGGATTVAHVERVGPDTTVVRHWSHVPPAYQYYRGPTYAYDYDWYVVRHITHPELYLVYVYEPVGVCVTEYYFYEGVWYCYTG